MATRTTSQIEETSELSKASFFAKVQREAYLSENGLDSEMSIIALAGISNLIFALDNVSLSATEKSLGCDVLNGYGYTDVNTQESYAEGTYWEEGFSY